MANTLASTSVTPVTPSAPMTTRLTLTDSPTATVAATQTTTATVLMTTPLQAEPSQAEGAARSLVSPHLYLPLVSRQGETAALTPTATLTATPADEGLNPPWVDGVQVYQQWSFTATQDGQPLTSFAEPLLLLIDARWLVEQGIDPADLQLWSRESPDQSWQLGELRYAASEQQYIAEVTQPSVSAVGEGLTARGDILPSATLFTTDRGSGAATVHYPLEVPTGLGGLAPALSLDYSSNTVDDFCSCTAMTTARVRPTGWATVGISADLAISTVPRPARPRRPRAATISCSTGITARLMGHTRAAPCSTRTPLVASSKLSPRPKPVRSMAGSDHHRWHAYSFGDLLPDVHWPSNDRPGAISQHLGRREGSDEDDPPADRVVDRWYLNKVRDPLGNRMSFHYQSYRGSIKDWEACNTGYKDEERYQVWYTSAVLPSEVRWSYTDSTAESYRMRVRFVYSGEVRTDYAEVEGFDSACQQARYTRRKLTAMVVEVRETTGLWQVNCASMS